MNIMGQLKRTALNDKELATAKRLLGLIEQTFAEYKLMFEKAHNNGKVIPNEALDSNGAIIYANGNDSTPFDWQMNDRLCEFMQYWKNTEMGFIKFCINRNGSANIYIYDEYARDEAGNIIYDKQGKPEPMYHPIDKFTRERFIPESTLRTLYRFMVIGADEKKLWDKPISELMTANGI